MLLQRYCYWENFKLAVYLRFVGLRALHSSVCRFVYLVWFWLVESTTANGTRLSFVRASERAPPQITRSSRVKVTYLYHTLYLVRTGEGRAHYVHQLTASSDHIQSVLTTWIPDHKTRTTFFHSSHVMTTYHRDIHMYMELAMRVRDENERYVDVIIGRIESRLKNNESDLLQNVNSSSWRASENCYCESLWRKEKLRNITVYSLHPYPALHWHHNPPIDQSPSSIRQDFHS